MIKKLLLLVIVLFSTIAVKAQEESPDINYRRSSLYTVMIDKPGLPYAEEIKKNFTNIPIPDKFNDHNLEKRVYAEGEIRLPEKGANAANVMAASFSLPYPLQIQHHLQTMC